MNVVGIQRILATCVETLIREGFAAEAEEAIRQGRLVADRLGPITSAHPTESELARDAEIREQVRAAAGLLPDAALAQSNPIKVEE